MPGQRMLDELNDLHHDFLAFGRGVARTVVRSIPARHESLPDRLGPAAAEDDAPGERGRRVVERCQRIMLLYQPVAVDHRRVATILRMTVELEEIGHVVIGIAERTVDLTRLPAPIRDELTRMAVSVAEMISVAVDVDEDSSTALTQRMSRTRAETIAHAVTLTEWLTGAMKADPAAVEPGLGLFVVVQSLHLIADLATHLAEEVADLTGGSNLCFRPGNRVVSEPADANHGS